MLSIIGFIITLSILVFIHEFGHYCIARYFNVKVEEFSIGFGKALIGITDKKGVRWKICLIPFGGYVKIYGYDRSLMDKTKEVNEKVAFDAKSCLERFLIVAAGPLINYLLAIIIFAGFYCYFGKTEIPPIIGNVVASSPAERADLRAGDKIVKVNDKSVKDFGDVQREILINGFSSSTLTIERKSEEFIVNIMPQEIIISPPEEKQVKKTLRIGIIAKNEPIHTKIGILGGLWEAINTTIDMSALTLNAISQMIVGKRSFDEIGGPIAIAKESGKSIAGGTQMYLLFIAMLSVNLGLLNLLPIPVLDGGHLVFILYEAITGKLPHPKTKNILLQLGAIIIIFLIIIAVSNDIQNLFS
ncbi:RIP metalloprotease RseP [Rickettsia parkeri str. Tate's Hell]|uniref:Zinc metalloprotease n=1 Tax=Rickettsia parkeri str. Tate's Hell TaxID=1359189 RepID=A0ABR5DNM3_RICPA|nr:RIP metalloprotease RseP [Rickettsia parkeri]AFC74401.1 M50 family membrane endopeptidase [Rickettsia parkeri str. Portsmouth]KJV94796.1 RIP metalloprotease RseP [Rickettsia parkeri str. Grand Bay]KJV96312.1 RIP metalloprotease RseP [Rickettsia parkeri str. AT\